MVRNFHFMLHEPHIENPIRAPHPDRPQPDREEGH
jgi:hypothetical protein